MQFCNLPAAVRSRPAFQRLCRRCEWAVGQAQFTDARSNSCVSARPCRVLILTLTRILEFEARQHGQRACNSGGMTAIWVRGGLDGLACDEGFAGSVLRRMQAELSKPCDGGNARVVSTRAGRARHGAAGPAVKGHREGYFCVVAGEAGASW